MVDGKVVQTSCTDLRECLPLEVLVTSMKNPKVAAA
jgi:hypothetical protein